MKLPELLFFANSSALEQQAASQRKRLNYWHAKNSYVNHIWSRGVNDTLDNVAPSSGLVIL